MGCSPRALEVNNSLVIFLVLKVMEPCRDFVSGVMDTTWVKGGLIFDVLQPLHIRLLLVRSKFC